MADVKKPDPDSLPAEGTIEFRVRYQETDQMGVVYHGNYFAWFEMGRTELLRETTGLSYRDMEESGNLMAIVKAECSYKKPARYDDILSLRTRILKLTRVTIEHEYLLYRGSELLAIGHTVLACINREGHPTAVPDFFLNFHVEPNQK